MDELGPLERERLMARYGRTFAAGEAVFREGDVGTEAFLLQEGRVRLIKRIRAVERSLMVLRPGDLFGESALILGAARSSTAIALSDGAALALDQRTFEHLLEVYPAVGGRLVQQLVRRLRDAEDQIELMMLRDPQSKIVAALLKAAQQAAGLAPAGGPLLVAVSPMELSTRVGLDVDAVKRGVQRLREGHYVRVVDEQLEILDLDALRRLYGLLGIKDQIRGNADADDAPRSPRPAEAGLDVRRGG
jgi:CRP-like cAMP-binding protein